MVALLQHVTETNAAVIRALEHHGEILRESSTQNVSRGDDVGIRHVGKPVSLQGSGELILRVWPSWSKLGSQFARRGAALEWASERVLAHPSGSRPGEVRRGRVVGVASRSQADACCASVP